MVSAAWSNALTWLTISLPWFLTAIKYLSIESLSKQRLPPCPNNLFYLLSLFCHQQHPGGCFSWCDTEKNLFTHRVLFFAITHCTHLEPFTYTMLFFFQYKHVNWNPQYTMLPPCSNHFRALSNKVVHFWYICSLAEAPWKMLLGFKTLAKCTYTSHIKGSA